MNDWRDIYELEPAKEKLLTQLPQGYTPNAFDDINAGKCTKHNVSKIDHETIKYIKDQLYQVSQSPWKSIPLNLIMTYMAPSGLSIITIGMVGVLIMNTFKDIMSVNSKFKLNLPKGSGQIDPYDVTLMKIIYIGGCLANLGVAIWKLNSIGLIPSKQSDWLHWEQPLLSKYLTI